MLYINEHFIVFEILYVQSEIAYIYLWLLQDRRINTIIGITPDEQQLLKNITAADILMKMEKVDGTIDELGNFTEWN